MDIKEQQLCNCLNIYAMGIHVNVYFFSPIFRIISTSYYRGQHISIKASFSIRFAVVARFRMRSGRRDLGLLRAWGLMMRVGCHWVEVLLVMVAVMAMSFLLEGGLLVLTFFLLLVLLLFFQLLFPLSDPHELDPPLLSTQYHWRSKRKAWWSCVEGREKENNRQSRRRGCTVLGKTGEVQMYLIMTTILKQKCQVCLYCFACKTIWCFNIKRNLKKLKCTKSIDSLFLTFPICEVSNFPCWVYLDRAAQFPDILWVGESELAILTHFSPEDVQNLCYFIVHSSIIWKYKEALIQSSYINILIAAVEDIGSFLWCLL